MEINLNPRKNRSWLLKKEDSSDSLSHPSVHSNRPTKTICVPAPFQEPVDMRWREIKIDGQNLKPLSSHAVCYCDDGNIFGLEKFQSLYSYGGYEHNEMVSSTFARIKLMDASLSSKAVYGSEPINKWEVLDSSFSPGPRRRHSLVSFNKRIYLFGGEAGMDTRDFENKKKEKLQNLLEPEYKPDNEIFIYSISSNRWAVKKIAYSDSTPPSNLASHIALVVNKEMIVFGGYSLEEGVSSKIYALDFSQFQWRRIDPVNGTPVVPARVGTSAVYHAPYLYVFGGECDLKNSNDLWRFPIETPSNNSIPRIWSHITTQGSIPRTRSNHTAIVYENSILVFGGSHQLMKEMNDLFELDLNTFKWTELCEDSNRLLTLALTTNKNKMDDKIGGVSINSTATNNLNLQNQQQNFHSHRSFLGIQKNSFSSIYQLPEQTKENTVGKARQVRHQRSLTENSRNNSAKSINNVNQNSNQQTIVEPSAFSPEGRARSPPGGNQKQKQSTQNSQIRLSSTKTLPTLKINSEKIPSVNLSQQQQQQDIFQQQFNNFTTISTAEMRNYSKNEPKKPFVLKPHQPRVRAVSQQLLQKVSLTKMYPSEKSTSRHLPTETTPEKYQQQQKQQQIPQSQQSQQQQLQESPNLLWNQQQFEDSSKNLQNSTQSSYSPSKNYLAIQRKKEQQSRKMQFLATIESYDFCPTSAAISKNLQVKRNGEQIAASYKEKIHSANLWADSPMTISLKDSLFRVGTQSRFLTNNSAVPGVFAPVASIKVFPPDTISINRDSQAENNKIEKTKNAILGKKPCPRDNHASLLIPPHYLLVFGGDRHHMSFNEMYVFDLSTLAVKNTPQSL